MIKAILFVGILSLAIAAAPYNCISEAGELVWSVRRLVLDIQLR